MNNENNNDIISIFRCVVYANWNNAIDIMRNIHKLLILLCLIFIPVRGFCDSNETEFLSINIKHIYSGFVSLEKNSYERYNEAVSSINKLLKNKMRTAYGQKALTIAIYNNDYELVKFLLEHDVKINYNFKRDNIRLGIAMINRNIEMAKLILDYGYEMTVEDVLNAIRSYDTKLMGLICKRGIELLRNERYNFGQAYDLDIAIEHDDPKIINTLIDCGVDPDYLNVKGITWLASACKTGYSNIAAALVERGANIEFADKYGMTPLIWASWYDHAEIVKFLIGMGANINAKTTNGTTALMFAAMAGNIEVMKILIEKGAIVSFKNDNDINAAMEAITSGQTEAVALLQSKGANIAEAEENLESMKKCGTNINEKDKFGTNLIIIAAAENDMEKLKLLIDRGAVTNRQIEAKDIRNSVKYLDKKAAIFFAVKNNNEDMVKLLVEKGAIGNGFDESNNPLLSIAAKNSNYILVKYLIDKKMDVNEHCLIDDYSKKFETPLINAIENIRIMDLLIKNGADINQPAEGRDYVVRTPLMVAVSNNNLSAIELLVKHGADVNRKAMSNEVAINYDCKVYSYIDFPSNPIKCTIDSLTSLKSCSQKITFTGGRNALHEAVDSSNIEAMKILIKSGADLNDRNIWGWTPLMFSIRNNNLEVLRFLIDNGGDVNLVSKEGLKWTAILEAAVTCKNPEIINFLVSKGANVNQRSIKDWTPLMFAIRSPNVEIVDALIKNGADVNAINDEAMSVLDIAENINYAKPEILDILKKSGARNNIGNRKIGEVKENAGK